MKNPVKLKELILSKVDLADVMQHYDVKFAYNPKFADEAQFSCPFHGKDNKPSARYYRSTQTCYCWVCRKKRDVVSFIKDKKSLSFKGAMAYLIDWYKIDTSSISDDPEFEMKKRKAMTVHDWANIDPSVVPTNLSFMFPKKEDQDPAEEETIRSIMLRNKIKALCNKIPFEKYNAVCSVFYMILFEMSKGVKVFDKISKLESKLNNIGV
jgi:hypothetical protein